MNIEELLDQLEEGCQRCSGTGRTTRGPAYLTSPCVQCRGHGVVPTYLGSQLLDLLLRHLTVNVDSTGEDFVHDHEAQLVCNTHPNEGE